MTWTTTTRGRRTHSEARSGALRLGAYSFAAKPNEWFWFINDGETTRTRGYTPTLAAAQQAAEHALAGLPAGVKG